MKISKLTAGFALSVVTTLLMGLLMGTGGGIFFFLLMLALILVVGARFAISVHDDREVAEDARRGQQVRKRNRGARCFGGRSSCGRQAVQA